MRSDSTAWTGYFKPVAHRRDGAMVHAIKTARSWILVGSLALLYHGQAIGASDQLPKSAVREGNLMIYGTTQADHMHALIKHFNQKYPAIKANYPNIMLPPELPNNIPTPTLFLKGQTSDYILDTDLPHIQNHFPNATLTTIPNAGHWLHAENPLKVISEIKKEL